MVVKELGVRTTGHSMLLSFGDLQCSIKVLHGLTGFMPGIACDDRLVLLLNDMLVLLITF